MRRAVSGAALCAMILCLPACDRDDGGSPAGKAEGQILPRSVTDEMLPYDTVRSQPPLAEIADEETPGGTEQAGGGTDRSPSDSADSRPSETASPERDEPQSTPDAE